MPRSPVMAEPNAGLRAAGAEELEVLEHVVEVEDAIGGRQVGVELLGPEGLQVGDDVVEVEHAERHREVGGAATVVADARKLVRPHVHEAPLPVDGPRVVELTREHVQVQTARVHREQSGGVARVDAGRVVGQAEVVVVGREGVVVGPLGVNEAREGLDVEAPVDEDGPLGQAVLDAGVGDDDGVGAEVLADNLVGGVVPEDGVEDLEAEVALVDGEDGAAAPDESEAERVGVVPWDDLPPPGYRSKGPDFYRKK